MTAIVSVMTAIVSVRGRPRSPNAFSVNISPGPVPGPGPAPVPRARRTPASARGSRPPAKRPKPARQRPGKPELGSEADPRPAVHQLPGASHHVPSTMHQLPCVTHHAPAAMCLAPCTSCHVPRTRHHPLRAQPPHRGTPALRWTAVWDLRAQRPLTSSRWTLASDRRSRHPTRRPRPDRQRARKPELASDADPRPVVHQVPCVSCQPLCRQLPHSGAPALRESAVWDLRSVAYTLDVVATIAQDLERLIGPL